VLLLSIKMGVFVPCAIDTVRIGPTAGGSLRRILVLYDAPAAFFFERMGFALLAL
jgi:hypothetical protein